MRKDTNGFFDHFALLFEKVILSPQSALLLFQLRLMTFAWEGLIAVCRQLFTPGMQGTLGYASIAGHLGHAFATRFSQLNSLSLQFLCEDALLFL